MIYEVQISIFGQKLSTTVHASDKDHLVKRIKEEIKVEAARPVHNTLAEMANEFGITELVR